MKAEVNPPLQLFFLVTVLSQTLLAFVSSHFMFFSFFTTWHNAFLVWPHPSAFGGHLLQGEGR
jgi:hypothetical protein